MLTLHQANTVCTSYSAAFSDWRGYVWAHERCHGDTAIYKFDRVGNAPADVERRWARDSITLWRDAYNDLKFRSDTILDFSAALDIVDTTVTFGLWGKWDGDAANWRVKSFHPGGLLC